MELYQTAEAQQLTALKTTWNRYGKPGILALIIVILSVLGWNYYQHHINVHAEKASQIFESMMVGIRNKDIPTAESQAKLLQADYAKTPYAELASMVLAKLALEKNDLEKAQSYLEWTVAQGNVGPALDIAKVRLAKILIAREKFDEALALLKTSDPDGYVTLYEEAKGDYYMSKGEIDNARTAYQKAIQAAPAGTALPWIKMKLDDLGS